MTAVAYFVPRGFGATSPRSDSESARCRETTYDRGHSVTSDTIVGSLETTGSFDIRGNRPKGALLRVDR